MKKTKSSKNCPNKKLLLKDIKNVSKDFLKRKIGDKLTRDYYRNHGKYSDKDVSVHFGSWGNLLKTIYHTNTKDEKPKIQRRDDCVIEKKAKLGRRYVVSAIVDGANVCEDFLSAIDLYCKKNNAELVLLWMRGNGKKDTLSQELFDRFKDNIVTDFVFNSNLRASDFMLSPAQILPITGLERYGTDGGSLIIASPKQFLRSIGRPMGAEPHCIWTTGTISTPKYSGTRIGRIAKQDNILGALVVEVEDIKRFYVRQLQWKERCIIDLGIKYTKDNVGKVGCEAIVWGDLHIGETSEKALYSAIDQVNKLGIKNIVLHDVCSFNSICHFDEGKHLLRVCKRKDVHTLEKELNYLKQYMLNIRKQLKNNPKFIVVYSNHDNEFVKKYLNKGEFIKDTPNAVQGAKCFISLAQGGNVLADTIKDDNIEFLGEDEIREICGWTISTHGHYGMSGSRGSVKQKFYTSDNAILGHFHQPEIMGNAISVGTLSKLKLDYTHGDTKWVHANAIINKNGSVQMIVYIDDKWKL